MFGQNRTAFTVAFLIIISLVVNAWLCVQWGYYADDWVQFKAIPPQFNEDFWRFFFHDLAFNGELRPLRAIEWLFKRFFLNYGGGLVGLYLFQASIMGGNAALLYLCLKQRFSWGLSFLLCVIFLLSPIDSTSQWFATMHWKLAIFMSLLATHLALSQKYFFSAASLIASLLFHESPIAAFVLFPLLSYNFEITWKENIEFRKAFKIFALIGSLVLGSYLIWRFFIASQYMGDFRLKAFAKDHKFNLVYLSLEYLKRWFYGYMVIFLLPIGTIIWRLPIWHIFFASIVALISCNVPSWQAHLKPPAKESLKTALFLITSSLFTIPCFNWLALYQAPARHLGMDSKLNTLPSISLAFLLVGLFLLIFRLLDGKPELKNIQKYAAAPLICFMILFLDLKFVYQLDYSKAKETQSSLITFLENRQAYIPPSKEQSEIFIYEIKDAPIIKKQVAIEPVSYWGGPWSGRFKVFPKYVVKMQPSKDKPDELEIYYEGSLEGKVKRSQIVEISDKLASSALKSESLK